MSLSLFIPKFLPRLKANSQPPCLELASPELLRSDMMFAIPQPASPSSPQTPQDISCAFALCQTSTRKYQART